VLKALHGALVVKQQLPHVSPSIFFYYSNLYMEASSSKSGTISPALHY